MDSPPKASLPLEGWGEDPKKIEAIIKDNAEVLAMYREEMVQGSGARNDLGNNVTEVERVTGNSRAYSIARVKKDCDPDTVAEVLAMYREEMKAQHGGDKRSQSAIKHDNIMVDRLPQGTSRAYSIGSAAIDIARSRNEPPKTSRADRDSCKRLA